MKEIRTEKFTETTLSIRWFVPLRRDDITAWNLLVMMLSRSTEEFATRDASSKACAMAYGARCAFGLAGYGHSLKVEFRMSFLRENLVNEPDYTDKLIRLYEQFMFHPLLTEDILNEAKYLLSNSLTALHQDPDARAIELAFGTFEDDSISTPLRGSLEDLDSITLEDIHALYERLMQADREIFVCGTISEPLAAVLLSQGAGKALSTTYSAPACSEEPREVREERDISQSSLCEVYASGVLPDDPDYYPMIVLNALLGASSVSLLFEEVREKNSLCYSISSTLIRFSGLLVISTGADRRNLPQVAALIEQILDQVREGKVSEETFELVKSEGIDTMKGQNDSAMSMIEQSFINEILDRPITLEENIENIAAVTLDQVSAAARRLKLVAMASVEQSAAMMDEEADYAA